MSRSKLKKTPNKPREKSMTVPPLWYVIGLVPADKARKLTPAQAELLREGGRHIPPERVEGEAPDSGA
jgi:hypothetical protein